MESINSSPLKGDASGYPENTATAGNNACDYEDKSIKVSQIKLAHGASKEKLTNYNDFFLYFSMYFNSCCKRRNGSISSKIWHPRAIS